MSKRLLQDTDHQAMRLDKWLWCARFFKSRQIAVSAIKSHKITVNGTKAKPSRLINSADWLRIDKKGMVFEVKVLGLSAQRLSAPLAAQLYEETSQSIKMRLLQAEHYKLGRLSQIKAPKAKPDKRNRQERAKLKRRTSNE